MQDKVWQISDPAEKKLFIEKTKKLDTKRGTREKSPALAFSLSLLMWGGGQVYNDQIRRGVLFLFLMGIYYGVFFLSVFSWETVTGYLSFEKISIDNAFIAGGLFYGFGVLLWSFNADQAYHTADKTRREPFRGVDNRFLPFLCSMLVPGWGQFLNGQDKKGGVFLGLASVSLLSVASIVSIILLWTSFEVDQYRIFFEMVLVISFLYTPFIPLVCLISSFDALKVSIDELKKESLLKRIKYANNRRKMKGIRGIIPSFKMTVALVTFFLTLLIVGYFLNPLKYYTPRLTSLQVRLADKDMVIIPYMIEQFIKVAGTGDDRGPES